jgi:hypothetical protein
MKQMRFSRGYGPSWRIEQDRRSGASRCLRLESWALLMALAVMLAGCGSTKTKNVATSPQATRTCLASSGFRVSGGPVSSALRGTSSVVTELLAPGAFIAFYPSEADATRAQPAVAQRVARLHGSLARRRDVTVLFVGDPLTAAQRQTLLRCVP